MLDEEDGTVALPGQDRAQQDAPQHCTSEARVGKACLVVGA